MIGAHHLRVLRKLYDRLSGADIDWAVTGSLGFALQGVPIEVHDIDLQSDEAGVYAIERLFSEFVIRPAVLSSKHNIRSHLGALLIEGVEVEIMGDIQKPNVDGTWEEPTDLARHKRFVEVEGMRIPVLSLEYEEQAYRKMGRIEKAEMLRQWLESSAQVPGRAESGDLRSPRRSGSETRPDLECRMTKDE